jgi:CheY-like chemotaxis protein
MTKIYTIRKFDPTIGILKALDGTEALVVLNTATPDAIILDINMPIMNGFEFLDRYAVEFTAHAPVVAMLTSSHLGADCERAMKYPFVRSHDRSPAPDTGAAFGPSASLSRNRRQMTTIGDLLGTRL